MGFLSQQDLAATEATRTENSRGGVPAGKYEVIIKNVQERAFEGGSTTDSYEFVIRNDVQQNRQNSHIFTNFWTHTEKTLAIRNKIVADIAKAIGMTGQDLLKLNSFAEWQNAVVGKAILINVTARDNEYNGETTVQNSIFPNNAGVTNNIAPTAFPQINHQWPEGAAPVVPDPFAGNQVEISDSELPF